MMRRRVKNQVGNEDMAEFSPAELLFATRESFADVTGS